MSEQEVLDLVKRWADIELRGDADAYEELVTADFTGIGPVGFMLNKEQWVGRHRSGNMKNEGFEVKDATVRTYGDTAVVVAVQDQKTTVMGRDTSGQFRLTLVAVKQDGAWKLANAQLSGPLMDPKDMPINRPS
jgi:uncharacterized protein (TIGR02246 family)